MADGIRIHDAALEISPSGVEALVNREGAEIKVTKIDLSISPEAINTLLAGLAPEGAPVPAVAVSDGRLQVTGEREGKRLALDLQLGNLRLRITPEGLHLASE
jgi:hypothetical protein